MLARRGRRIWTAPRRALRASALPCLVALALLAGCGDDDDEKQSAAAGNSIDRAFAGSMIPHHEGAVEMARPATTKAEHQELRKLARDIIAGQGAEIRTLRRIDGALKDDGVKSGDLGLDEHQMGMDHDVHTLESAKVFDREFIDMMVPHHEGAIRMSRVELRRGENAELRRLAGTIIESQEREIRQMRSWRKAWYSKDGKPAVSAHGEHEMAP